MRSAMYEEVEIEEGAVSKLQSGMARKWQHLLDVSAPHTGARWGISAVVMVLYAIRIYLINGGLTPPQRDHPACAQRAARRPEPRGPALTRSHMAVFRAACPVSTALPSARALLDDEPVPSCRQAGTSSRTVWASTCSTC